MARLIPTEPPGGPHSEQVTRAALASLPDSWIVISDIPFGLFGRPRPGLRQIDFLVIHPRQGLIVLEVKGGRISVENGEWFTTPRGGERQRLSRSPFTQAADARYELARYLSEQLNIPKDVFSHGVVLTDSSVEGSLGPDAPRDLILDEGDLVEPGQALRRVTALWNVQANLGDGQIDAVISLLKPTLETTVVLAARSARTERTLERETRRQVDLVESQIEAYEELLRSSRAIVVGGAGTGKTVLAVERARRLAHAGSKTLLLCHRRAVSSFMSTLLALPAQERSYAPSFEGSLHLAHWTGLLQGLADAGGRKPPGPHDPALADWILSVADELKLKYDGLVVDEGQEFTQRQFDALAWLLADPEDSALYVFADPFQHSGLYSGAAGNRRERVGRYAWRPPIDGSLLRLTQNCRNSRDIAELAALLYPEEAPVASVDGVPPDFIAAGTLDEVVTRTITTVQELLTHHGFKPNQVLVVAVGVDPSELHAEARRASPRLGTAQVGGLFRFPLTPIDVRVAVGSADEVQGLEAEAVVVAYWQPDEVAVDSIRDLYVATTRARSVLQVVSNTDQGLAESAAAEAFARLARPATESAAGDAEEPADG